MHSNMYRVLWQTPSVTLKTDVYGAVHTVLVNAVPLMATMPRSGHAERCTDWMVLSSPRAARVLFVSVKHAVCERTVRTSC